MSKNAWGITHRETRIAYFFTGILSLVAVSGMAQSPDLVINRPRLAATVELQQATFSSADCAVVEGCIRAGTRTLLKFDVGFQNVGNGDLVIGDPNARPDLFEASTCHGHFHMRGVAIYELLNGAGAAVVRARKQGWCFRDNEPFSPDAGPGTYTCDNQGISAGWEDVYDKSLDCQWLDVTGLPGGKYLLRVVVNPDRVFSESNYGNNTATVSITLPGTPQTTTPPPASKPPPPKVQPTKPGKKLENAWKKLKDQFKQKKPKKHKGKGKPKAKVPVPQDHDDDDGDGKTGDHDKDDN